MNIEDQLRKYKSNLSKQHLIECEMQRIENEIQLLDPSYISAVQYSDVPKSITNKFSSVTENTVIEIEQNRQDADRMKADLWQKAKERIMLKIKAEYVEALLEGLGEEERFVIELHYIEGLQWPMVADKYRSKYGMHKSIRMLKYKRNDAFAKMSENCTVIAR